MKPNAMKICASASDRNSIEVSNVGPRRDDMLSRQTKNYDTFFTSWDKSLCIRISVFVHPPGKLTWYMLLI